MKKLLLILLVSGIFSCDSKKKEDAAAEGGKNQPGIQNVNGNIPDTTNAVNLDTHKKDSTTSADSLRK